MIHIASCNVPCTLHWYYNTAMLADLGRCLVLCKPDSPIHPLAHINCTTKSGPEPKDWFVVALHFFATLKEVTFASSFLPHIPILSRQTFPVLLKIPSQIGHLHHIGWLEMNWRSSPYWMFFGSGLVEKAGLLSSYNQTLESTFCNLMTYMFPPNYK